MITKDGQGIVTQGWVEVCTAAEEVEHPQCVGEAYLPYAGEVSPHCVEAAYTDSKEEGFLPCLGEGSMPDPAQTRIAAIYLQEKYSWNTYEHTVTKTSTVS